MTNPLDTWKTLNDVIMTLDEQQVAKLLKKELRDQKRGMFAFRLHSRLCRLRTARERAEIIAVVGTDAASKISTFRDA